MPTRGTRRFRSQGTTLGGNASTIMDALDSLDRRMRRMEIRLGVLWLAFGLGAIAATAGDPWVSSAVEAVASLL